MKFLVAEIRNAGRIEQNESLDPSRALGTPPDSVHFRHPIKVTAEAVMTGDDIVVSGQVGTTLGFTCGRCLEEYERPYQADFQQVFDSLSDEIDISNDIQETVFIDLPLNPVCREECKGLCSTCGKNKNLVACNCSTVVENPRMGILKEFRFHNT